MNTKRIKTLAVSVFALMMIVALSACGSGGGSGQPAAAAGGDAYALYTKAAEAMEGADGYAMDMDMKMSMDIAGQSSPIESTGSFVVNDPTGNIEMKMVQSMSLMGQDMDTTSYIKDGSLYTEAVGQKMKIPMDAAMLKAQASNVVVFPEDAIIDEGISDDADGGKMVSFTIKGDAMSDFVKKQMSGTSALGDMEGLDMSIGDAKISALIDKDGNLIEYTTEISLEMNAGAAEEEAPTDADAVDLGKISMDMTAVMRNIKIGKTEIDFPADLDTYTELDASALEAE